MTVIRTPGNPGPLQKTVMDIGASTRPEPVAHLGVSCAVVVPVQLLTDFDLSTLALVEVYPIVTY